MLLSGAKVVPPSNTLEDGWLRLAGGRIEAIGTGPPPVPTALEPHLALTGRVILPGLIDLHVHGGGGGSFTGGNHREAELARVFHRSAGTTRSLASLVTAALAELVTALSSMAELTETGLIAGVHLEGPFLSRLLCGAQHPRYLLAPDAAVLDLLMSAGRGTVRMVTVAPELPGALDLIRRIVDAGAIAAIGACAARPGCAHNPSCGSRGPSTRPAPPAPRSSSAVRGLAAAATLATSVVRLLCANGAAWPASPRKLASGREGGAG